MLRDGLNLYGVSLSLGYSLGYLPSFYLQAIWIVNMVNVLFWFIVKPNPDGDEGGDSIRTIITRYDVPHFNDRSHVQMRLCT